MSDPKVPGNKTPRLGRGLDALLGPQPGGARSTTPSAASAFAPIEDLHPNRGQPRTRFDDAALEELAASIRELGVLEPILVRRRSAGGFEIVAGERRWRASQRAGLREVPIFVRELSDAAAFEAALVENVQRADLNPIETARALDRLLREHGYTQDTLAARIGKDRSTVANAVRLLKLPAPVLAFVEDGALSEGHARALLSAADVAAMTRLAREAIDKGWSVRETERQARTAKAGARGGAGGKSVKSANVRELEARLSRSLGTRVSVEDRSGKGRIEIPYSSLDELDRLLQKLL